MGSIKHLNLKSKIHNSLYIFCNLTGFRQRIFKAGISRKQKKFKPDFAEIIGFIARRNDIRYKIKIPERKYLRYGKI